MIDKIIKVIEDEYKLSGLNNLSGFTATSVAEKLSISRSSASQYLNSDKLSVRLIKVNTRPVYFFSKKQLEQDFSKNLNEREFESIDSLKKSLKTKIDFEDILGHNGSLNYSIEQCKGAIMYPPLGLPVLIYGETGTGKSMIANSMYNYAINNEVLGEKSPFITLNCSEFADNPDLLVANLFGAVKGAYTGSIANTQGLIKSAEGGILFLDEVHCLKAECQEKLFLFMDQGIYHMLGDNKNWYQSKVRLIFATTATPEKALLKTFLRRIPIVVKLPSLDQRPAYEKSNIIKALIEKEEEKIGRKIEISPLVHDSLLEFHFKGNVGHMINCLKASCANAIIENTSDTIYVNIYNLPDYIINEKEVNLSLENQSYCRDILNKKAVIDYKNLSIIDFLDKVSNEKQVYSNLKESLDAYFDSLMFKNEVNPRRDFIKKILTNIFDTINAVYSITISHNALIAISNFIFDLLSKKYLISQWWSKNNDEITKLKLYLKDNYLVESKVSNEMSSILNNNIGLTYEEEAIIEALFIIVLASQKIELNRDKTPCVIICHGYSTASSIADATNKILGEYIFDAIDMPLEISTLTISQKLVDYFQLRPHIDEAILLVDMGSLEQIYKRIQDKLDINIGIINNITTRIAIEIGEGVLENEGIETILKNTCKNNISTYKVLTKQKKEDAIILACSTGEGTAKKLKELFIRSLPKQINLKILGTDYESIKEGDKVLEKYSVKYLIGTLNPNIVDLEYISLEKIINLEHNDILRIFSAYLNLDEIEEFKRNLMRNFSIHNLINHLTILNPEKVILKVQEGLELLQEKFDRRFKANTLIGLCIHISCLIERLIMKNFVKTYKNFDKLTDLDLYHLNLIKDSFSVVEEAYSVEIPEIELAYINDYIKNDIDEL